MVWAVMISRRESARGVSLFHLLEHVDGEAGDLAVEERVEGLVDEEPDGGEHGEAAVGDLGLAEALDLVDGLAVGEVERVEEPEGEGNARHGGLELGRLDRREDDSVDHCGAGGRRRMVRLAGGVEDWSRDSGGCEAQSTAP